MRPARPPAVVVLAVAVLVAVASGCSAAAALDSPTVAQLRPDVLAELPHDPAAFTEGYEEASGVLYEGTGLAGRSQLRELDPATGAVRRFADLPGRLFGEGVTVVGPSLWQLTYRDGVALEWDRATLTVRRQVPIEGEGWGLCAQPGRLVQSDGTDRLRFRDPATFAETGSVAVTLDGAPVAQLNELECVGDRVWANVWQTDRIVEIDPASGHVVAVVDASGLLTPAQRAGTDVLNGIAADGPDTFLVTGKFWPTTFRVRFVPVSGAR